ncbi:MAG: hypothetical protein HC897_12515 [Thermoanaerobaculia bacterium]|nr:hypothetical protein [Thermoanaerobaculia bacterium]
MNLYVLVEGRRTEKAIYRSWLCHCFPKLQVVDVPEGLRGNSLYIIHGGGYPQYEERIIDSLVDIRKHGEIQWFLICVDSEEMSREEKLTELEELIDQELAFSGTRFVIQHCCIETWLLGNQKIFKRNPQSARLRGFIKHFDVSQDDPELMPALPGYATRAQFHLEYLREVFRERNLAYTKSQPGSACEKPYFDELVRRCQSRRHIPSFGAFLEILSELGLDRNP